MNPPLFAKAHVEERLIGIVNRITFHNPNNGWSVLRVEPFGQHGQLETVTVHQTKVFAGATIEFFGEWRNNPKFGRQFYANRTIEHKPATAASLEKYLGSGLIKGVGPKTAKRIVRHFQQETLDVFEHDIERLQEVPGIASKKLASISSAWHEHRNIRDVMLFLQQHGISTLFAVRIYQSYGDKAIEKVKLNPYTLADDFYGIGFFSADKIALSIGFKPDSDMRIRAAIKHVLSASREQGHCYLLLPQVMAGVYELIEIACAVRITQLLNELVKEDELNTREVISNTPIRHSDNEAPEQTRPENHIAYYSRSLYFHETHFSQIIQQRNRPVAQDTQRVEQWVTRYCDKQSVSLSAQQQQAVIGVIQNQVAILTGGPGCGKTTTTLVIVRLLEAMNKKVTLMAPTGRAAQRMGEVIGREAKTVHRLLEWKAGQFQVNQEAPLQTDFVIVDESSMLDISLANAIAQALPDRCQLLFIGDADQLPSVGAGNVLKDLIKSNAIPCFRLTQIFRQAAQSQIIQYAHDLNKGQLPRIDSPFHKPACWKNGSDCLFLDSDEATQDQLRFIHRIKRLLSHEPTATHEKQPDNSTETSHTIAEPHAVAEPAMVELNATEASHDPESDQHYLFRCDEPLENPYQSDIDIPSRFEHVNLESLKGADSEVTAFKAVLKKIHPWSSLHYGLTAVHVIVKLYTEWIPKYIGTHTEIQILSPMTRGSLGTINLNQVIQNKVNPQTTDSAQLSFGQRTLRVGDRVIHRRNNYDLNVYNGDIGRITAIDTENIECEIQFSPDDRLVHYKKEDLSDLDLAYAITIHKSQGSEFEAVIMPVLTQHFKMLYRNLLYTGLTRAKRFAAFVGTRRALAMGAKNEDTSQRQTALAELI